VIEYVEVTPADIETANRLAGEVLGRSLDELPPQTRRVLTMLDAWVTESCREMRCERPDFRFTTREVRDALSLGVSQAKVHLSRLVELEYLVVHRAVPGQPHVYELLYSGEGDDGRSFLPGLLDPGELHYDGERPGSGGGRPGQNVERPGGGRPLAGARPGPGRSAPIPRNRLRDNEERGTGRTPPLIAYKEEVEPSYVVAGHRNGSAP
jgi:hypothetical protein